MKLRRLLPVACGILLVAGMASAADETERIQRTVPLPPGGTLRLDTFSGHVNITPTDRSEVVIDAVRRAPRERLDRIKLDIQVSGSTVRIEANKKLSSSWWPWRGDVVETDMEIQVPRRTNLEITAFSSPVTVTGVEGQHRVHTFSGGARLVDVAGHVKAETFSGRIDLQLTAAATQPDLDLHTFSGDIDVRAPAGTRADVDFDSFSGDLRSDVPLTLTNKSRRSLRGSINAPGTDGSRRGSIYLKTFSGDVRIHG